MNDSARNMREVLRLQHELHRTLLHAKFVRMSIACVRQALGKGAAPLPTSFP